MPSVVRALASRPTCSRHSEPGYYHPIRVHQRVRMTAVSSLIRHVVVTNRESPVSHRFANDVPLIIIASTNKVST